MKQVKSLVRKAVPKKAIKSIEESYRVNKARIANVRYGRPSKHLKIIAITGTNGKTTTCSFVNEILKTGGFKTAIMTTAYFEIAGKRTANTNHMTVASVWSVMNFLSDAKKHDVDWVILEVTSHALDQHRLRGIDVDIAAITNLSQDHLDYHGTMENYAEAKAKLITNYGAKNIVLNGDDEWFNYFKAKSQVNTEAVGKKNATYRLGDIALSPKGTKFSLSKNSKMTFSTKLVGEFNIYNAAIAAVVGFLAGVKNNDVIKGVKNVYGVPGRLEPVDAGQKFSLLVDYAHTPDALERVLKALQTITKGKVRVVFGATGDRDASKRPIMGEVAAKNADMIYLTDDETYTEDPQSIRDEVREGIEREKGKFVEIGERKQAIKQACLDAQPNDVVVLTGIGHQDYRAMAGEKEPWDERVVAREIIKKIIKK